MTNSTDTTSTAAPQTHVPQKAYDPAQYGFLGFFLSVVPLFYMSFKNSRLFKNGEYVRSKMKIFLAIFIAFIVIDLVITGLATHSLIASIKITMLSNQDALLRVFTKGGTVDAFDSMIRTLMPNDLKSYKSLMDILWAISVGVNLILLILMVRFTNRNELPDYKEMKAAGTVTAQRLLVPVLIGIGFVILYSMGINAILSLVLIEAL